MNSSQGAPVHTGAALGCSFCCGRGEVAQKTKELCLTKVLSNAGLMDSKAFFLTANTTSVYMFSWLQLGDEPLTYQLPSI